MTRAPERNPPGSATPIPPIWAAPPIRPALPARPAAPATPAVPGALTGLTAAACAACCVVPLLLAAGVVGGAGWALAGRVLPGVAVVLAATAGLAWWRAGRRRRTGSAGPASGADSGGADSGGADPGRPDSGGADPGRPDSGGADPGWADPGYACRHAESAPISSRS